MRIERGCHKPLLEPWAWDYDPKTRTTGGHVIPSTCPRNLNDYGSDFDKGLAVWWYVESGKLTLRDLTARDYEHAMVCHTENLRGGDG